MAIMKIQNKKRKILHAIINMNYNPMPRPSSLREGQEIGKYQGIQLAESRVKELVMNPFGIHLSEKIVSDPY